MSYSFTSTGSIVTTLPGGKPLFLPPENNGTPEWAEYQYWLDAGNTTAPHTPDPSPADYFAFWEALIQTGAYASIRSQAAQSLVMNTAATEFIALIGDAKAGRPLQSAIQSSIYNVLNSGTFTESELTEFQDSLAAGNIADVYTLIEP